ncbi:MAG: helix-turn-helix transcriptional regulator [Candidatus Taylorbacteria bacterium]
MTYTSYNSNAMKKLRFKYKTLEEIHRKDMRNPEFKREWDALEVEFQIIHDILDKRIKKDMTQAELARKSGIGQATLSRLETGNYNPSIKFLKRIAKALDLKLTVRMV